MNEHTRQQLELLQKKQQLEKRSQQVNGQMQNNPQTAESANYCSPPTDFQDCRQFQNHLNSVKGQCKCRCLAINCMIDHFNLNVNGKGKRNNTKRGNMASNKKFEQQADQFEFGDEQVYNKNLEDLMDYIMQPEGKKKKKPKKRKGQKEESDDEKAKAVSNISSMQCKAQSETTTTKS